MPTSVATNLDILAKTIVAEAGGEPHDGQLAVAWVAKNRSRIRQKSVAEVCLEPWQFSCWNQDPLHANPVLLRRMAACSVDTSPEYLAAVGIAALVMTGRIEDPTGGATHYHTLAKPPGVEHWPPGWAHSMTPTTRIGRHQFYRED